MANGRFILGKQSGGTLGLVFPDGVENTEVVLPESGELVNKAYADGKPSGFKNLIINPNKAINQTSLTGTALNVYYQDQWAGNGNGGLYQKIESLNVQKSGVYTISWTGTATCTISESTDNITYTVIKSGANSGTNVNLTANRYVKVDFSSTDFTNVQLEFGSIATPLEQRPHGLELLLCQRYYQAFFYYTSDYYSIASTYNKRVTYPLLVAMRATPTVTQLINPVNTNPTVAEVTISNIEAPTAISLNITYPTRGATGAYMCSGEVRLSARL